MALTILPENAQQIDDRVLAAIMEICSQSKQKTVSHEEYKNAERKVLISMGIQPSVYHRKMQAIWEKTPWVFRAFEYIIDEEPCYFE